MAIKLTHKSSYNQLISWFLISWPVILTLWSKEPNICYIFEKLVNHGYQIVTQLTLQIISWSANNNAFCNIYGLFLDDIENCCWFIIIISLMWLLWMLLLLSLCQMLISGMQRKPIRGCDDTFQSIVWLYIASVPYNVTVYIFTNQRLVLFFQVLLQFCSYVAENE